LRRPGAALASLLVAAALAHVGTAEGAEAGVPVAFSFDGCPEALAPPVERIARIELHAPADARGAMTQIGLVCSGDDVHLIIDDPLTSKRVDRTVSLAQVAPEGRARLLALAIAELVRSSWVELDLTPTPSLPPSHPVESSSAQRAEARTVAIATRSLAWRGSAAVDGLLIPTVGHPILGLTLGLLHELPRRAFAEGALSAWDGLASRTTGDVAIRQLALDGAVGLRVPVVDLSVGLRVGWTSLSGSPSMSALQGQTTSGVVFGPLLVASVQVAGPLRVWARTGWLLRGERGVVAGDSDVTVGGYWASLGLGLGLGS